MPAKFRRNHPSALANPSQRRLRITSRFGINHLFQGCQKSGVGNRDGLAPRSGTTDAALQWHGPLPDFPDAFDDCLSRKPTGTSNQGDSSIPQTDGFTSRHDSPRARVQKWPHRTKLLRELGKSAHAQSTVSPLRLFCYLYLFTAPNGRQARARQMAESNEDRCLQLWIRVIKGGG